MNLLTALYFPETSPPAASLRRLLLFFDLLSCLRPVEEEEPNDPVLSQADLVQEHAPAPLGAGRRKFQQFIDDVRHHGAEHTEGLLASLSFQALPHAGDDTMWSIVSSISKKPENRDQQSAQRDLWQARFILKISELHAAAERELLRELAAMSGRKQAILQALQGDEEDDLANDERGTELLEGLSPARLAETYVAPHAINVELLLTAWMRLLLHNGSGNWPRLLATASASAAATLLDHHEAMTGEPPWLLGRLSLPTVVDIESDAYPEARQQWRTTVGPAIEGLGQLFSDLQQMAAPQADSLAELQARFIILANPWESATNAGSAGQDTLLFYLLPRSSLQQLAVRLAKTKLKGEQLAALPAHTLLAVLETSR